MNEFVEQKMGKWEGDVARKDLTPFVLIGTPVATVRDWEQGRYKPAGSALVLCKVAINNPAALLSVS